MAEPTITLENNGLQGRYIATLPGSDEQAELAWLRPEPGLVDAVHTFTPAVLRGQGIAAAMMERLISDARAEGFRIIPSCTYVAAQFRNHPE